MNGLLLVAAMLAVLNPPLRASRLPRLDGGRAVAAAAVALAVVVAVAAAAGPVLDAGDVSAASARVGAGLVVVLAGLVDLVRGRSATLELPPGAAAAAVPVAFPVLLEPQVAVLALAAGADRGVLDTAAAAAAALGLYVAAAWRIGPGSGALLVPVGRLVGAVGVVVGTALVADGVLSV